MLTPVLRPTEHPSIPDNMPPKNQDKKAKPAAAKVVADKTFGMKNKKGGKAQKDIQRLQSQASSAGTPEEKRKREEKAQREKEKKAAEEAKREAAELFKPVQVQKVPFGVDPKTVVCVFFKKGNCEKGMGYPTLYIHMHTHTTPTPTPTPTPTYLHTPREIWTKKQKKKS